MNPIPKLIVDFIKSRHVLSFASCNENKPHCVSLFYLFLEDSETFIFKSDSTTKHIRYAIQQPGIAGAISNHETEINKIIGIQFSGTFEIDCAMNYRSKYYQKFPYARFVDGEFFQIKPVKITMIDNCEVFGKKIHWEKEQVVKI